MSGLLLVHAAVTWFLAGLIWFVQVVHYPLMSRVGAGGFAAYERDHTRLTTWVVAPAMLIELGTGVGLLVSAGSSVDAGRASLGLATIAAIWLSTLLLQVPRHRDLERGFDARAHRRLVRTNWVRTAGWTARALLVVSWLAA